MTGQGVETFGYRVLRIFHWTVFFVVVEIMLCCAGWMIFGAVGVVLDGVVTVPAEEIREQPLGDVLQAVGKGVGLLAGVFVTIFCLGRYYKPRNGAATHSPEELADGKFHE